MNVKPGQILPVNYQFWPAGSENIVQAMVMRQIGDFYELCPVHANIDSAGFFDLIVSGKTIKSEMDLVVMCRDSARFPALALNTLQQDEDYDMGPI